MFYFIISFLPFYRGAIIYNLPNYIIPSVLACLQLGSSGPQKSASSLWEWLPIIHFNFRAVNYPNCRLRIFCSLYLFLLHMCYSPSSLMEVPSPSASALMWIITEPHHCPQSPCQHLLMFPVCTSR